MAKLTNKQKLLWNEAVRQTLNEVYLYDGLIPEKEDRKYLVERVKNKMSYKHAKVNS